LSLDPSELGAKLSFFPLGIVLPKKSSEPHRLELNRRKVSTDGHEWSSLPSWKVAPALHDPRPMGFIYSKPASYFLIGKPGKVNAQQ
jgi:hypothetical protein